MAGLNYVDESGINFSDYVIVWTEDQFSNIPKGENQTFSLKSGAEQPQQLFIDARSTTPMFMTQEREGTNGVTGGKRTFELMKASGEIKTQGGETLKFDESEISWTDRVYFRNPDGIPSWAVKGTDLSTGNSFYVSSYGFAPGESYKTAGPGDNLPFTREDNLNYFADPNISTIQGQPLDGVISDAVTGAAPAYVQGYEDEEEYPGIRKPILPDDLSKPAYQEYIAYDLSDFTNDNPGANSALPYRGDSLALKEGFKEGVFRSTDNDNYISDGNTKYSSLKDDLDQIGSYVLKDTGEVIIGNNIYQGEYAYIFEAPDGTLIKALRISFKSQNEAGQQIILASQPLEPEVRYKVINTDGSPGLVNKVYGQVNLSFKYSDICFTAGTMIKTEHGEKAIETLEVGDKVWTRDHGYQPIRWIGSTKRSTAELKNSEKLRPIRIKANALGMNVPSQDLEVSRQHRIAIQSRLALRFEGVDTVLVAAKELLDIDGIEILNSCEPVEYFHIMFDEHQIIEANGASAESLYTGPQAMRTVAPETRAELLELFPELDFENEEFATMPIVPILEAGSARSLVRKHTKHSVALQN